MPGQATVVTRDLRSGFEHPIAHGRRLWLRSLPRLLRDIALPLAAVAVGLQLLAAWWRSLWPVDSSLVVIPVLLLIGAALSVVAVALTDEYFGQAEEARLARVAVRFVPWVATLALVGVIVVIGTVAFVIPGIYLSLRLFWADEYALLHGMGPLAAIRASWRLSRGYSAEILRLQSLVGFAQTAVWLPGVVVMAFAFNLAESESVPSFILDGAALAISTVVLVVCYAFSHSCEIAYFYGLQAEREAASASEVSAGPPPWPATDAAGRPLCQHCGTAWNPADYRLDAGVALRCSACKGELRPAST